MTTGRTGYLGEITGLFPIPNTNWHKEIDYFCVFLKALNSFLLLKFGQTVPGSTTVTF